MVKTNKKQVYKDYVQAKQFKTPLEAVWEKHDITKQGMYFIVREIERGNLSKIKACTEQSTQMCLWEHKYKLRFSLLPKNRQASTIFLFKELVREMKAEGFKPIMIASLTGRDRATIIHHLTK